VSKVADNKVFRNPSKPIKTGGTVHMLCTADDVGPNLLRGYPLAWRQQVSSYAHCSKSNKNVKGKSGDLSNWVCEDDSGTIAQAPDLEPMFVESHLSADTNPPYKTSEEWVYLQQCAAQEKLQNITSQVLHEPNGILWIVLFLLLIEN